MALFVALRESKDLAASSAAQAPAVAAVAAAGGGGGSVLGATLRGTEGKERQWVPQCNATATTSCSGHAAEAHRTAVVAGGGEWVISQFGSLAMAFERCHQ